MALSKRERQRRWRQRRRQQGWATVSVQVPQNRVPELRELARSMRAGPDDEGDNHGQDDGTRDLADRRRKILRRALKAWASERRARQAAEGRAARLWGRARRLASLARHWRAEDYAAGRALRLAEDAHARERDARQHEAERRTTAEHRLWWWRAGFLVVAAVIVLLLAGDALGYYHVPYALHRIWPL